MKRYKKKRHFLLLEVLIAFFLVVICIIPLMYPHTFILTTQTKFVNKIELDHLVNNLYADIVEQLYSNKISWSDLIGQREFAVQESLLKSLPYKGTYRFVKRIQKPKKEESLYTLYLFYLDFSFMPKKFKGDDTAKKKASLTYHYEIFVVRDLRQDNVLPEDDNEEI